MRQHRSGAAPRHRTTPWRCHVGAIPLVKGWPSVVASVAAGAAPGGVRAVAVVRGGAGEGGGRHTDRAAMPVVTKVSPKKGASEGGTRVSVTGTGFKHVTRVVFGATAGTGVKVVSTTHLLVT